jgi:hypothetical protein
MLKLTFILMLSFKTCYNPNLTFNNMQKNKPKPLQWNERNTYSSYVVHGCWCYT